MLVYAMLLGASLLGYFGAPWWVVPIGAAALLLESADERAAASGPSHGHARSLMIRLARNVMFVGMSFLIGLVAAGIFAVTRD
jgi:hypothetical protein